MKNKPKISVITASKNGARFLRETIESIQKQTFTDHEHVFVDSLSTDNTVEILKEYDHMRWISEPDRHADEGFYKAAEMSRGEYIMFCCVSDKYANRDWFRQCVEVLDNDPEVSLVYGLGQQMTEEGDLGKVVSARYFKQPPPRKMDFFPFWLGTFALCLEITFCVRTEIFRKCFPRYEPTDSFLQNHALLAFNYNFNINGYLPYFLPVVASYGRDHHDSNSRRLTKGNRIAKEQYWSAVIRYGHEVLSGKRKHVFRDGRSDVIRAIEPQQLERYRQKVLDYRINRKAYLGKKHTRDHRYYLRKFRILILYYLCGYRIFN